MRIVYNELSKEVTQVIQDDNSITAFPPGYAVLQGTEQACLDIASLLGLDTTLIPNTMSPERLKVLQRVKRCEDLRIRFLSENAELTITAEEAGQIAQNFMNVMLLLQNGEARTALSIVSAMPNEYFPVTSEHESSESRKQSYVNELAGIVTDLFDTV